MAHLERAFLTIYQAGGTTLNEAVRSSESTAHAAAFEKLKSSFRFLARGALRSCPEYIGELTDVVLSRVQVDHVEA